MKTITANHTEMVMDTVLSGQKAATSTVAASWCRSALHFQLDPSQNRRRESLSDRDLTLLRDKNGELLAVADPVLSSLFKNVEMTGCCVILADAAGMVLSARANAADIEHFGAVGLQAGADWSEAAEGTNGIGTCLIEERPVTIYQAEHFATRNIGFSCMDAPVFDPNGLLVGAIDVSTGREMQSASVAALVAALVRDAARQIERSFFCRHFSDARIVDTSEDTSNGFSLLALDQDDLVIGATRAARKKHAISQAQIEANRPICDVLSADQTACFVDAERKVLRQALARARGNLSEASRALGIGRATFYRRMKRANSPH